MKIDPKHDYKKPLYAAGLATLIGATAVFGTACGPQIAGGMTISETTTAVQLGGDTYNPEDDYVELAGETTTDTTTFVDEDEAVCSVETEDEETEEEVEESEEEETEAEE
jgi:hypothetical protein